MYKLWWKINCLLEWNQEPLSELNILLQKNQNKLFVQFLTNLTNFSSHLYMKFATAIYCKNFSTSILKITLFFKRSMATVVEDDVESFDCIKEGGGRHRGSRELRARVQSRRIAQVYIKVRRTWIFTFLIRDIASSPFLSLALREKVRAVRASQIYRARQWSRIVIYRASTLVHTGPRVHRIDARHVHTHVHIYIFTQR